MRQGEKCVFTVSEDMFNGKLKKGHRYIGKYWLPTLVYYRNWHVPVATVEPIKKPTVKKEKAPTASDYKNFADLCFEVAIRYRDNWQSVISGKKFEEGDWNGLQAGHGCSRTFWDTRHNTINCHAITSGENYAMSIGNAATIMKYWNYVAKTEGQRAVDYFTTMKHATMNLTIAWLKADCREQYEYLWFQLGWYAREHKVEPKTPEFVVKWRCEKLPKKKAEGIMKVLKIVKGEM